MIERGHRSFVESLYKTCAARPGDWPKYFHATLWADRITTKRTTGFLPYFLLYGVHALFPFDISNRT